MRSFKVFILALVALVLTPSAIANQRLFRDIKLPTQKLIEKQSIANIVAGGQTNLYLFHNAGPTSAAVASVTSFAGQPDVPRNLQVIPAGTTGDVESCVVTVAGTDILNDSITEAFTFSANASTAQTGNKAFKTITSVSWAADCESGGFAANWSVGNGEKIGLKRCMDSDNLVLTTVGGSFESTRATVTYDADEVSKNTADFNGTMNGSNDFEVFFIQNHAQACQP